MTLDISRTKISLVFHESMIAPAAELRSHSQPFLTIVRGAGQPHGRRPNALKRPLTNSIAFSAPWRVGFVGISSAPSSSAFSVCSRAAAAAITLPSASRGGTRPRRSASIRARSRKAPASSASRRSTAPACAAPISRSRSRALGDSAPLGYGDELRPAGRHPERVRATTPRWPIVEPRPAPPAPTPYDDPTIRARAAARRRRRRRSAAVRRPQRPRPWRRATIRPRYDQPVSLDPPPPVGAPAVEPYDFRKALRRTEAAARAHAGVRAARRSMRRSPAYDLSPEPYERRRTDRAARRAPPAAERRRRRNRASAPARSRQPARTDARPRR